MAEGPTHTRVELEQRGFERHRQRREHGQQHVTDRLSPRTTATPARSCSRPTKVVSRTGQLEKAAFTR
jgi:hypothetical protein